MNDKITDEDYFYLMAEKMNKMPTEEQLKAFLKEVSSSIRVKAFVVAMGL
jgi:hypothetical protein